MRLQENTAEKVDHGERYTVVIFKGKKTMKVEIITKMQVKREEC